jgi:hypothetical protein
MAKRWGLVELTELRGMQPRDVAALNITTHILSELARYTGDESGD